MRVDCHQHFWRLDRGDYTWLTPSFTAIYRDFGPQDLAPSLQQHRIDATVLVQAAATVAETDYMLDVAARHSFVRGVVGWVDFDGPGLIADIDRLAQNPLIKSFRPMIQDIADPDWMLQPQLAPGLAALQRHDIAFDALLKPPHLQPFRKFLKLYPDLRIVIDHGAKPAIAAGGFEVWAKEMREIARDPRVLCKLSGLATEAGVDWTEARLRPYVDLLLQAFGPERLMWGSDWPVINLAGGYDRWHGAASALIGGLSAAEQDAILGGTATSFYRL
ncbi:MAG TPA: amidohydrolase family protein [Terriglobales bacterium]|nr:amidohydrolase family protein [Terriglobales bacterium]